MPTHSGHAAANAAAASAGPQWQADALEAVRKFAKARRTFTMNEVREAFPHLATPPSGEPRAWGAICVQARKHGYIARKGYTEVTNTVSNARPVSLWASLIFTGDTL